MRSFATLPFAVFALFAACDSPNAPVVERDPVQETAAGDPLRPAWAGSAEAGFLVIALQDAPTRLLVGIADEAFAESLKAKTWPRSAPMFPTETPRK